MVNCPHTHEETKASTVLKNKFFITIFNGHPGDDSWLNNSLTGIIRSGSTGIISAFVHDWIFGTPV